MNTPSPAPQGDPNDALLERFVLGELDPERSESLRRLAAANEGLRARIIALGASDSAILNLYPVEAMTRAIRERAASLSARTLSARTLSARTLSARTRSDRAPSKRSGAFIPAAGQDRMTRLLARFAPGRIRLAGPVFALLACGIFLLARHDRNGAMAVHDGSGSTQVTSSGLPGDIRLKGAESGLAIFRKTASGSELLPPRSTARTGDTLQVFYHSRQAVYGIVFSVDGAGAITLHYPEADGPAPALRIGDMLPLPHAFRLDKAPRYERFYLVTAPRPFGSDSLLSRLRGQLGHKGHQGQKGHMGQLPADASPADTLPGLDADFRQYPYTIFKAGAAPRKSRKEPGR